jgi:16S rRNA (guanine966-N2)-methyltransferase
MRISGGIAKGRKIKTKKAFTKEKGYELRPTSSKVRQAIFNILQSRIIDAHFLDLFAGTGAVGIEALSRGSERVVFVEENPIRVGLIKETLERFGFKDRGHVLKEDAIRFLKTSEETFDIIFADPPYRYEHFGLIFSIIAERNILKENGLLIVEHSSKGLRPFETPEIKKMKSCFKRHFEGEVPQKKITKEFGFLRLVKTYVYGDTSLSLYRKESL